MALIKIMALFSPCSPHYHVAKNLLISTEQLQHEPIDASLLMPLCLLLQYSTLSLIECIKILFTHDIVCLHI